MAQIRKGAPSAPVCDVFALNEAALRRARKGALDAAGAASLAATFRILGNPSRVRILDALGRAELCVCDLAALLGARISAVSHQLALLRRQRLVRHRRAGKLVFYTLDDRHVRTLLTQARAHTGHAGKSRVQPAPQRARTPATPVRRRNANEGRRR